MDTYAFHITLYDLAFLAMIITGLNFALQLWFTKKANQGANQFLSLALLTMVLWMAWLSGNDVGLSVYFPYWRWLPFQFWLALGPLIYIYVLKITRPQYKFGWKGLLLHFIPVLLQQGAFFFQIKNDSGTIMQSATFVSVAVYLYLAFRLIERFYQGMAFNDVSDRYHYELRWLRRLLIVFGLAWLLWIPFTAVDYFYYRHQAGLHPYYLLYLVLAITMIWMAAKAFSHAETTEQAPSYPISKLPSPAALKQKGIWLKKTIKEKRYYQDPELSLGSLAEKLEVHTHELSRIINTALKKNFNDFINEYRVADVVRKMQDAAYDHITLLGIAYESGFNSQTTFNRIFKQITGKSPVEYKNELKKEQPTS